MSIFFDQNENNVTLNVRVDKIHTFILPKEDSNYEMRQTEKPLHHVYIECTVIQWHVDDTFTVNLTFNGQHDYELEDLRSCYEIGKLIRVKGNFFASHLNKNDWTMSMTNPVASYLPKVVIETIEGLTGAKYLPQTTLESSYELP